MRESRKLPNNMLHELDVFEVYAAYPQCLNTSGLPSLFKYQWFQVLVSSQ